MIPLLSWTNPLAKTRLDDKDKIMHRFEDDTGHETDHPIR